MIPPFDDPVELARATADCPRPLLVALDVDGVLAPIVAHAHEARLLPGVGAALARLAEHVTVAVVSGRSVDDLARFGIPEAVSVVGSHGAELDGRIALDADEQGRLDALVALAEQAAEEAGDGAWVEHKPASVALHIREADSERGDTALRRLASASEEIDGATTKAGSAVLELLARPASKGAVMHDLRARHEPATIVFVGDDLTDEDGFAALQQHDVTIKVGDADTVAVHRLRGPDEVLVWLDELAAAVAG